MKERKNTKKKLQLPLFGAFILCIIGTIFGSVVLVGGPKLLLCLSIIKKGNFSLGTYQSLKREKFLYLDNFPPI
jgi:hypothetical protein